MRLKTGERVGAQGNSHESVFLYVCVCVYAWTSCVRRKENCSVHMCVYVCARSNKQELRSFINAIIHSQPTHTRAHTHAQKPICIHTNVKAHITRTSFPDHRRCGEGQTDDGFREIHRSNPISHTPNRFGARSRAAERSRGIQKYTYILRCT